MNETKISISLFPGADPVKEKEYAECTVSINKEHEVVMTRIMRETNLVRIEDLRKIARILEESSTKEEKKVVAYLRVLPPSKEAGERTLIERRLSVMRSDWKCFPLLKGEELIVPCVEDSE